MLDRSNVDLDEIAIPLDDHSDFARWWIDVDTGEVWAWSSGSDDNPHFDPEVRHEARFIEPLPSSVGYRDMEEFIARCRDPRAAALLGRVTIFQFTWAQGRASNVREEIANP